MAVDLQTMVDTLSSLDEDNLVRVISSVLQARPEVAPPIMNFSIPDLTYPPSRALTERRAQGVIKSFNPNSGFGFIDCPELHSVFGNDVFLHNKQLGEFGPGAPVTFAVCLSKDNKPQAYDLQHAGSSGRKGKEGFGGCKGGGGCSSIMPMSMMAPTIMPAFDMMAQMQMMKGKGWGFKGKDDDGGFRGDGFKGDGFKGDGFKGDGCKGDGFKGGKGCKGKWGAGKGKMEEARRQLPPGAEPFQELGNFVGTIKSFNPKSGYGFITCEELQELGFSNDCFLHHQQMGDCSVGQEVGFLCYLNSKGQPQAKDVVATGEEIRPEAKGGQRDADAQAWEQEAEGEEALGANMPWEADRPPLGILGSPQTWREACRETAREARRNLPPGMEPFQELGHFTGTIKSFNNKFAYGFIACPEIREMGFNNDVYLHVVERGDCAIGQEVSFFCYLNTKGLPQAKEVTPVSDDSEPASKRFKGLS